MKFYFECPKCGNDEQFVKPSEESSDLGCALYLIGGFLPALMYWDYKRARVQCTRCSHIFRQPSLPSTPLATFAGWILGLTLTSIIAAVLVFSVKELSQALPSFSVIAFIEETIVLRPRVAAYLLATLFVLIVVSCCVVGLFSTAKFRKQLAKEYHLKPLSPTKPAPRETPKTEAPTIDRVA